jgi:hypothetical protein
VPRKKKPVAAPPLDSETSQPDVKHAAGQLVQTRIPHALYDQIKEDADVELMSISGWIRRLIVNHSPAKWRDRERERRKTA